MSETYTLTFNSNGGIGYISPVVVEHDEEQPQINLQLNQNLEYDNVNVYKSSSGTFVHFPKDSERQSLIGSSDMCDWFVAKYRKESYSSSIVSLGTWNGNLDLCKEMADTYGIPMIAVWSNQQCAHCAILERAMSAPRFTEWMRTCNIILCFTCSADPDGIRGSGDYYKFCKKPNGITSYPFMRFYWYKNGQKKVDFSIIGDKIDEQKGIAVYRDDDGKPIPYTEPDGTYHNLIENYDVAAKTTIENIVKQSGFSSWQFFQKEGVTLEEIVQGEYVPTLGEWNSDYRGTYNYAILHNIPFIALVTKFPTQCHYCELFDDKWQSDTFLSWAKSFGAAMGLFQDNAPYDNDKEWVDWVAGSNTGYPFIRLYWKKTDGTVVSDQFMGRTTSLGDWDNDGIEGTQNDFIVRIETIFAGWKQSYTQDGDIRNSTTYVTGMEIYPRGWIYFTGSNDQDASTLLEDLDSSGYRALVFQHAAGCTFCANFINDVLHDSEVISALANSNLVLVDFYSGSGWWTGKNVVRLNGTMNFGQPNASILNGNQTLTDAYNEGNLVILQNASKSYFLNWLANYTNS